jgi:hypothetical protein
MALYLREANHPSKFADDYEVFDASRRRIGRIMLNPLAPQRDPSFWTITAHVPQSTSDRGYEATREFARADFKRAWEHKQ